MEPWETQAFFLEVSMIRLLFILSALFFLTAFFGIDFAHSEEGHHSIGIQAWQVGLTSDFGSLYGNALGYGAFFDYASSDWLEFELSYLTSKHTSNNLNYTQGVYGLSVIYNVDQFHILIPYLRGGAEFV